MKTRNKIPTYPPVDSLSKRWYGYCSNLEKEEMKLELEFSNKRKVIYDKIEKEMEAAYESISGPYAVFISKIDDKYNKKKEEIQKKKDAMFKKLYPELTNEEK